MAPASDGTQGTLTVTGNYSGAGGLLALDVTLGADGSPSDLLHVQGSAAGTTRVQVQNLGGAGEQTAGLGILVVQVDGGSTGDAFQLDGTVRAGRFLYDLVLQDDGNWYLVSRLGNDPTEYALAGAAVLGGWQVGVDDLHRHLTQVGLDLERPQSAALGAGDLQEAVRASTARNPSGLWAQVTGESLTRDRSIGLGFDQTTTGLMAGFDMGLRSALAEGDLLLGGIFANLVSSTASVNGSASELQLEGGGGGVYAAWRLGGFSLSGLVKLDSLTLEEAVPQADYSGEHEALAIGGSLEAGWRLELGGDVWLRPAARLSYVKAWIDDLEGVGGELVTYDDPDSLNGRLGLSAGTTVAIAGARFRPWLEVAVTHEFLGETSATVGALTPTLDLGGTGYEIGGGVTVLDLAEHLELRLDGRYAAGDQGSGVQVGAGLRFTW